MSDIIIQIAVDSFFSIERVLIGALLAIILGIIMGITRSFMPRGIKQNRLFYLFCEFPRFIPPIAWIPLVVLIIGINEFSAYLVVFIGAFPLIFLSTYDGIENVSLIHRNTAKSMEVSSYDYFYEVLFKAALPKIFLGIRHGMGMGWMSVVAAEMLSGQSGLGYSIELYKINLQFNLIFMNICLIGALGFFLDRMVLFFRKKIIPWYIEGKDND